MDNGSPRVLMIGLDALEVSWVDRFLAQERLPNLARLAESSARLAVRSDGFTLHGSLWPTFATGTPPGFHGVHFWQQWLAQEMRHVRNNHPAFAITPFWSAMAPAGMTATAIDLPHVPLVTERGFRGITAWGLHDEMEEASYPPKLLGRVRKHYGKHPLHFDTVEPQSGKDKRKMVREMQRGIEMRMRLWTGIARRRNWNLLLGTVAEFHKMGHYLALPEDLGGGYTNDDAIFDIVRAFDDGLPALIDAAGDDCEVFVFALHGMSGQVEYSSLGRQVLRAFAGEQPEDPEASPDLVRRIRQLLPDSVHRTIWQRLPARVRSARQGVITTTGWDYTRDRLFTVTHDGHPAVRANVAGRERDGFVDPAEVPRLLDGLERFILELRAEGGLPAFGRLWRATRDAPGPRSHLLPDALIVANPHVTRTQRLSGPNGIEIATMRAEARNGIHTGAGFCFYRGSRILPADATIDNLDFAPSVLSLLGLPPGPEMQGQNIFA